MTAENIHALFLKNVRSSMEAQGINITQLAEKLGVTRPTMSQVLSGRNGISLNKAVEISNAINVGFTELLSEKFHPNKSKAA